MVASGARHASPRSPKASPAERYYFVRALDAHGNPIAYSSPVWVTALPRAGPDGGEWLAGDLHVHTCFSHDAYCPPDDDNTGPDEFYTLGLNVGAALPRGLARAASTTSRSPTTTTCAPSADPDFGAYGVTGIPGYENSLARPRPDARRDHALRQGRQLRRPRSTRSPSALRADGGVFQINHPAGNIEAAVRLLRRHRQRSTGSYGYDVRPDTLEVWNLTSSIQFAETYWECWLERGAHVGATGGSDSHWLSTAAVQGVGNPTTWVFARDRSRDAILEAIRAGPHDGLAHPARAGRRAAAARGRPRRRRQLRVDRRRHRAAGHRRCACARPACPAAGS